MSVIDEVKERVDIVDVVSEYVPDLKKAGRNYRALCPFHQEKTPSFFVFPERQSWHCFGACGTGGDVFSFVMKKESIDFGGALRLLAQRAGITLSVKRQDEAGEEAERLYQANEAAATYYHHLLLNSSAAERARSYLTERGVSPEAIEDFQLGFSLESWDGLQRHLTSRGYGEEELVAAGLLTEKAEGGSYDRFRNRLMFPIRNVDGRVIGFGARALDDSLPKYLNSPQTPTFDKSGALYGIDRAKTAVKRQNLVVIVEGYMDAIAAHQYGFYNVVASMGTSLTEKQVGVLKRLTGNFIMALDADRAGEKATRRGLESVWRVTEGTSPRSGRRRAVDARVNIMRMPAGKDPDEVIRESSEAWQELVEASVPWMDFLFDEVASKLDKRSARSKSDAVDELLPFVSGIPDPIERAHYVRKLAQLVEVDEDTIRLSVKRPPSRFGTREGKSTLPVGDVLEEYCLSLLLRYPELKRECGEVLPDYFERSENRELFLIWRSTSDVQLMEEKLDPFLLEHLRVLKAKSLPPLSAEEQETAFADCIHRLGERWLRSLKVKEEALISDAESEDAAKLTELEERAVKLNAQLRKIFLERGQRKKGVEL